MASSELGTIVDAQMNSQSVNTLAEVQQIRACARQNTPMKTALDAIQTTRSVQWQSRKRVRSDVLRLFNEGALT